MRLDRSDLGEHRSPLDRIGGFLDKDPIPDAELVFVGSSTAPARANLLGLLTKSVLGVAVCGNALRVRRPKGAPGFWRLRGANRSMRYARGRGRKLR